MTRSLSNTLKGRKLGKRTPLKEGKYWLDQHPFKSHLMNALSAVFPIGERFFIDSVRAYEDDITDPDLRQDIKIFIAQEASHTKEHRSLNEDLTSQGYDIDKPR